MGALSRLHPAGALLLVLGLLGCAAPTAVPAEPPSRGVLPRPRTSRSSPRCGRSSSCTPSRGSGACSAGAEPATPARARRRAAAPSRAQAAVADDLGRDIWSTTGELSPGAYKNATDSLEAGAILPVEAVVDRRYLSAAR
jgi:hypothetical protein